MFSFLAWLDPFYKPWNTSTNFITIESELDEPTSENSSMSKEDNICDITNTSLVSSHDSDKQP